ncbi:hypothetical protein ACFSR6_00100 [Pedobacter vanadiisoli]|uniref:Uncharacterized protein n=1 Tax=Pedobacter vanadiisoli TaxID=1761975 RepID=A0ABW5MCJ3_9SPHI
MMPKEDKDLVAVHEDTFVFNGVKINYAVLESNAVLIAYPSILKLLNVTVNEVKDIKPIKYWNSKRKWNNGLYLKEIPDILTSLASNAQTESLKFKAKELLQELSHIALKALTGEKDIVEEEKKEPSFDQLLGALMKVPLPKNDKK